MTENAKKPASGLRALLRAGGKRWLWIAAAVAGLLLLLWGGIFAKSEQAETDAVDVGNAPEELEAYEKALENELEALCEAVAGVSDARVLVGFSAGWRNIYATGTNGAPATVGSGSAAQALLSTRTPPAVAGVGIVCRGGNDPAVQQKLIDLVSTALGIPTNRVSVAGR